MAIGNLIVVVFMTYYTKYFITLFNRKIRKGIKIANKEMDKIRKVPIKTVDEQKKFLDIKYPKSNFKFNWKIVPNALLHIMIFILLMRVYYLILDFFNVEMMLWQSILFVMIMPIVFNLILNKFGLQKSDMLVFLK